MSDKRRRGHDSDQYQRSDGGGASTSKRSRLLARRRKHLYLVLRDLEKGLSVHKIDTDSFDSDSDDDQSSPRRARVAGRLPEPPALRLETPGPTADMLFAAVDGKIFVVTDASVGQTRALVYDTETAGLAIGPAELQRGISDVVAARGKLYAFSPPHYNEQQSFHAMAWSPTSSSHERDDASGHWYPREDDGRFSWEALPGPPPAFKAFEINSYAVHPDGRTIFMTTTSKDDQTFSRYKSTYSFSTKSRVWRWHHWALPFRGQGHFDSELDAWVGLNKRHEIVCCRVPSDIGSQTPDEMGTTKELGCQIVLESLLFHEDDTERHLTASLTYMGRSRFCLVQSALDDDDDYVLLYLTMFALKYSRTGELRATNRRSTRSYRVPRHADDFRPRAFWV